jgi:hypothetical protein
VRSMGSSVSGKSSAIETMSKTMRRHKAVPPALAGGAPPDVKSTLLSLDARPPADAGGTDFGTGSACVNSDPTNISFASEFPTTHSISSCFRSEFTGPASAPIFQHAK